MGSLRHTLMMGIEKCNSHSGRVWQFLSKLKNALTVWLNDCILVHLSQWNDFFLCRNWYTNVHNSFIYNAKSWKQPRCPSVSEWLNKLWCIYTMNTQQWKGRIYQYMPQLGWASRKLCWERVSINIYFMIYVKFM